MRMDSQSLEEKVVFLLKQREMTLTTAESCTAGLVAGRVMNVPGASGVYQEGYITYSNASKERRLGVRKETLEAYGAVSKETAAEMALGAAQAAGADAALSVTGVAGPDGGTKAAPVGLIYIGCCVKGKVTVKECHFHGSRAENRADAVTAAMELLLSCLLDESGNI